jgi:hypothetical protein
MEGRISALDAESISRIIYMRRQIILDRKQNTAMKRRNIVPSARLDNVTDSTLGVVPFGLLEMPSYSQDQD